jgi:putative ABC transport system substrate-binding protein
MLKIGIARWNSDLTYGDNVEGFKEGLAEMGYVEGENVKFIIKTPESDLKIQRQIIESFVAAKVDLIYSLTTPGTLVAKDVTIKIPIVFSIVTYPVESGVIESLEGSNNNLVGTRNYITVERQYDQFEKIYAGTKILAFVHRKGEANSDAQYLEIKALLKEKGIEVIDIGAVDLKDMRAQLESVIEGVDSMFLACDTLINVGGDEIAIEISKKYKKPCFACLKGSIAKGALVGNVADFHAIGKLSGIKAGLILKGADPSSLLTESPAEDYVIINTKTAKELGIKIPQYVLDDAQEIVKE